MIEAKILNRLLGRVMHAVSKDTTRPGLAACHLYMHEKGALYAMAIDGHRAARVTRGDVRALRDVVDQHARAYDRDDWVPLPLGWRYCPLPSVEAVAAVRSACRSYSEHRGTFSTQTYTITDGFAPLAEREIETTVFDIAGHRERFVWPVGLAPYPHGHLVRPLPDNFVQELVIEREPFVAAAAQPYTGPIGTKIWNEGAEASVYIEASVEGGLRAQGTWIGAPWTRAWTPTTPQAEGSETFRTGVNRKYLLDALAACKLAPLRELRTNVRVQFGMPLDPIMFLENDDAAREASAPESESFVACIMPMRV